MSLVAKKWVWWPGIRYLVAKDLVFGGQRFGVWWPRIGFGGYELGVCWPRIGFVAKNCVWWPRIEFCGKGLGLMAKDWVRVVKYRV